MTAGGAGGPLLEKAHVFCYRLFDVAEEIDLDAAQRLLARDTRRVRLSRAGAEYLLIPNPPLAVELGRRTLALHAGSVVVEAVARLFDHGSVSVRLCVPVTPGTSLGDLVPLADELYDSPAVDALSHELLSSLRAPVAPALRSAKLWDQTESYAVHFVERFRDAPSAEEVLAAAELAPLLLGETRERRLSPHERADVTAQHLSYGDHDLVVVDWNAAFVYEPSGSTDIPDILEICNAQLLEFRYYDDQLDRQLARVGETLRRSRRRGIPLLGGTDASLARSVQLTLIEMSEALERVENSLKIIGDFYLAKVYEAALEQLRVDDWKASVQRKQQTLGDVYQWLKGEIDTARSLTLEMMIVLLIVVEVVLAFLRR
ncbi:MAG TPA: hypothetical protein VEJ89_09630 [Myxococcaceae bacterium]|nr:hypothetical protein [Myxococcaceae bacterium]